MLKSQEACPEYGATYASDDQLRVVEGLTGFSNMSLPCFSTKAFALLASIESSQGSCTSSLTWSSATSTVPVVLCPRRLARKSRWSPDHWFLNTNKPAPLDWASLKLAFNLLNASSLPRRCGSVTMIGWAIYWFLSRTTPSKRAGYRKAPRSLKRRGLGLDQTGRDRGTSVLRSGAKLQIESSSQALR